MNLGIAAVERDTGLSKDTLRVWERRYAFPQPLRDAAGERVYPRDQVEKLQAIKRLMDQGHRPGKIIAHSMEELLSLGSAAPDEPELPPELRALLDCILKHRSDDLRRTLNQLLMRQGLGRFILDIVVPLNRAVGEAWVAGNLAVFEEHLYTECVMGILRSSIAGIPQQDGSPTILLTTLPQEEHGLGLLMVEGMLALEGARCISLGVETPVHDIVRAALAHRVDVVALSFSGAYPAGQVGESLAGLRSALPDSIDVWAGGAAAAQMRRPPAGVRVIVGLADLHNVLVQKRARKLDS